MAINITTIEQFIKIVTGIFGSVFFLTYVGAICAHLLSLYDDEFKGIVPFLKNILPGKSDAFYFRINAIALPVIGAILAVMLLEPAGLKSSFFAGLSWSGALIALLKRSNNNSG